MKMRALTLRSIFAGCLLLTVHVSAQTLQEQATPFSVYLDQSSLKSASDKKMPLPIWLAGVSMTAAPAMPVIEGAPATEAADVYRFSLRPLGTLAESILLRVYFQDAPKAAPEISAWNEVGDCVYRAQPLGQGLDLPLAASLVLKTSGISYFEIRVPNGAGNLRGVFLGALRAAGVWTTTDFDVPPTLHDPFGNAPALPKSGDDLLLFHRVQAMLDGEVVKLQEPAAAKYDFEFQLENAPIAAVITFEVLNADLARPLNCQVGTQPSGAVSYQAPDLADPGYETTKFLGDNDARLRYTGWMRAQRIIPGSQLAAGWNHLEISLNTGQEPVAIRALSIQLKYPSNP